MGRIQDVLQAITGDAVMPTVLPLPEQNQVDAVGQVTAQSIARSVLNAHKSGLQARRQDDLLREKYLLHVDGSSDFQWADILYGERVEIPRGVSEFRKTENLLRPIVDNAVAHHTTMPLRYEAESSPDREARQHALVDTVWANSLAWQQDFNALFADAMYLAMPAGYCPVHCYWREDPFDQYEPIPTDPNDPQAIIERLIDPKPGMIDCWVGNPFDTVFDRGAKRNSVYWASYGRVLPARMVRAAFDHIPGVAGLEGTTRLPSAAQFQRIARQWQMAGLAAHGSAVTTYRRSTDSDEELMVVLCREILPGIDPQYPDGRLQLVAVPGSGDIRRGDGQSAVLLADQSLPAGSFSWTLFYSHHRADDVHGKPWVADLDELQVDLNLARSKRWEVINKMHEAPIVAPGGVLSEDMVDLDGYGILEVEPSVGAFRPQVMKWPTEILTALDKEIEDLRRSMYTIGGYQASSRGEAPGSRMAYRAIVALQQADSSIHGPVNMRFKRSGEDFMRLCWGQMKAYGDVPWLVEIIGNEYAHLAEPYIDNSQLSSRPPTFKLVNAFGPSPELRAQEVLQLAQLRGADGVPFMTTAEARRHYPGNQLFRSDVDAAAVRSRRARTIAVRIVQLSKQFRQQTGVPGTSRADPGVQQGAQWVFMVMEQQFPRLRDDDLDEHIATLTEITQDETADPIARAAAVLRQNLYYEWQAQMAKMALPRPQQNGERPRNGPEPTTKQQVVAQSGARATSNDIQTNG